MAPLKIVRIIARLNIGGPAVNAAILSSALDAYGFSTTLVYGSLAAGEGSSEELVAAKGVRSVVVPELGREISPWDDLRAFASIVRIIRAERPDIVHTHTAKAGTLGRLAAWLCGVPIQVHTYHGHVFRHYFSAPKTALFIAIERFLGLLTDKVVVLSEGQRRDIVDIFKIVPATKCAIVPLGVDVKRLAPHSKRIGDLRQELGVRADAITVGIIGRLVPIKNHRMLLEAAARLRRDEPGVDVRYLIVGDGELRCALEKQSADLGVDDVVHFLGWRSDLAAVYDALDIVALTSLNEGTPLTFIEAMARAKPIVATDVGGVSDIVEQRVNGILVGSGDVAGFAAALRELARDPAMRERFGAAGRRKCELFTEGNLAANMAAVYRACSKTKTGKF